MRQRLCWLAVLLAAEWIPISAIVHTARGGASAARFLIAFTAFFLILGYSRVRPSLPRLSVELQSKRIGWAWLLAHAGALIVFLRVQPVVVTLAMYFILQGVDLVLSPQPQALPGFRAESA